MGFLDRAMKAATAAKEQLDELRAAHEATSAQAPTGSGLLSDHERGVAARAKALGAPDPLSLLTQAEATELLGAPTLRPSPGSVTRRSGAMGTRSCAAPPASSTSPSRASTRPVRCRSPKPPPATSSTASPPTDPLGASMPSRTTLRLIPLPCLLIAALLWPVASHAAAGGRGGPIAASAKTKKQHTSACRAGALDVRTGNQRRCERQRPDARARDPQAPLHDLSALTAGLVAPAAGMLADGAFAAAVPALADGSLERALVQATGAGAGRPRALKVPVPETTASVEGWETKTTGSTYVPGENEVAAGGEQLTEGTKDILGTGELIAEGAMRVNQHVRLSRCPDGRGVVTGNAEASWLTKTGMSAPGHGRYGVSDEMTGIAAVTARVGDDAKLRDYDLEVKFRTHLQVVLRDATDKVIESNPPSLYTARIIVRRLKPGMGYDALLARMEGTLTGPPQAGIQGLSGPLNRLVRPVTDAGRKLHVVLLALADRTGEQLEFSERRWQRGECTSVRMNATKSQLKGGESTKVTVKVLPPKGERLAAGGLKVSLSGQGTLRPSGQTRFDRGVRTYTFTAPGKGWKKGSSARINARAVSRQGKAFGSLTLTAKQPPRDRAYFKVTALGGAYEMRFSASQRLPPCSITGEQSYQISVNPKADREKTDGSVKLSVGAGTILLPTLRTGMETYSASCDYSAGHVDNPCQGPIDAPDPLDFLTISRSKGTARITFGAPQQLWGVAPMCSQFYGDGGALANRDHPFMEATVPWAAITGTRPLTVSADDAPNDPNHQVTRSRTVTLQPVDEHGRPLR
jgi:hypothetical protein